MKSDLAVKLQSAMRGQITPITGVAGVSGVAGVAATYAKPLKLQRLRQLRAKIDKTGNNANIGVAIPVAVSPERDEVDLEERKAMAATSVPEPYLDAWARLQCQWPIGVGEAVLRQAIDAAGRFLDQWGSLVVEFQWMAVDLFDVPRDGRPGGLVWFLQGESVRALGPDHAVTGSGRTFDRVTRADWTNPYQKG